MHRNCTCCTPNPDLLQRICPSRTWERDFSDLRRQWSHHSKTGLLMNDEQHKEHHCKCKKQKKAVGRFGVAWISETPACCYSDPFGWQVEFVDTPSNVEQRCQEMVKWVNSPPLPREEAIEKKPTKDKEKRLKRKSKKSREHKEHRHSKKEYMSHSCICEERQEKACCCEDTYQNSKKQRSGCCCEDVRDYSNDCCCCEFKQVSFESCECHSSSDSDSDAADADDQIPEKDTPQKDRKSPPPSRTSSRASNRSEEKQRNDEAAAQQADDNGEVELEVIESGRQINHPEKQTRFDKRSSTQVLSRKGSGDHSKTSIENDHSKRSMVSHKSAKSNEEISNEGKTSKNRNEFDCKVFVRLYSRERSRK